MTKGKKLGTLAVIFTVFALLLTVAFSVNDKKEAKAYFKRISLKKCAISLSANYYDWSGKEIRPAVTVKYNGVTIDEEVALTENVYVDGVYEKNLKYISLNLNSKDLLWMYKRGLKLGNWNNDYDIKHNTFVKRMINLIFKNCE